MTRKTRGVLVVAAGIVQLACAESIAPGVLNRDLNIVVPQFDPGKSELRVTTVARTRDDAPGVVRDLSPEEGGEGSEIPPEWQELPSILSWETAAWFGRGSAWGQGLMHYFASHARQTVHIALRYNNRQVINTFGTSEESDFWPWFRDLSTVASVQVDRGCGHQLDASTEHTAWHQPPFPLGALAKWGNTTRSSNKPASQPACPPEPAQDSVTTPPVFPDDGSSGGGGEGGEGGGSGGWYTCYYYYEYELDTGLIVYTEFLGCVANGA